MAKLDGEHEPGYAEQMLTDDPILFESLCNEWLGEQEHERLFGAGYMQRNAEDQEDDGPDFGDCDPTKQDFADLLDERHGRGYAKRMYTDDAVRFEALYEEWLRNEGPYRRDEEDEETSNPER